MDMSTKQKSIKNDHQVADVLFLGALAISVLSIAMIGFQQGKVDAGAMYVVTIANIFIWFAYIHSKMNANHKELKSLIEGRS